MARRMSKAESSLIVLLIVIGLPIYLIVKFFEVCGVVLPIVIVAGVLVAILAFRGIARKQRFDRLLSKYGDRQIVECVMSKTIWVGETADLLVESLGQPVDVDEKVLKTKRKEVWKYGHQGGNRYGLRITVEDGVVVGWDEKL